jgi:hypothetical protein
MKDHQTMQEPVVEQNKTDAKTIRDRLVEIAMEWESRFGVAPQITSSISEYDAARLVGCSEAEYCAQTTNRSAVSRGFDFVFDGSRYQVKANRPSGKPGSFVTLVAQARNYEWDYLIWLLYDRHYVLQEAWLWDVESYKQTFGALKRISPQHMRRGTRL